ncbi:MAG: hypothetical protein ACRC7V_11540 [Lachnospiraceae bacterium]
MSNVILCIGKRAKNGYIPKGFHITLYTLEELCYFIQLNVYLLEDEFKDPKLVSWIRLDCEEKELADVLERAISKGESLHRVVERILSYMCFFSKEEEQEILSALKKNSVLSIYERKHAKADNFLAKKQYAFALDEYYRLLFILPNNEQFVKAKLYHCVGVCWAKLFYFEHAAFYFKKSYDISGNKETLKQLLFAKRFSLTEQEYLDFVVEFKTGDCSLEIETQLEAIKDEYKKSEYQVNMDRILDTKEKNEQQYCEMLYRYVEDLKEEYRNINYNFSRN